MSKIPGPHSRIPTFGTKIRPPQTQPNSRAQTPITPENESVVTSRDIGAKVQVSDKEGILRYVGHVHFAQGVWCGVELDKPVGKNDGSLEGKRYFTCRPLHGLITPQCRVRIIETDPYLAANNQKNKRLTQTVSSATYNPQVANETVDSNKTVQQNSTHNVLDSTKNCTQTVGQENFTHTILESTRNVTQHCNVAPTFLENTRNITQPLGQQNATPTVLENTRNITQPIGQQNATHTLLENCKNITQTVDQTHETYSKTLDFGKNLTQNFDEPKTFTKTDIQAKTFTEPDKTHGTFTKQDTITISECPTEVVSRRGTFCKQETFNKSQSEFAKNEIDLNRGVLTKQDTFSKSPNLTHEIINPNLLCVNETINIDSKTLTPEKPNNNTQTLTAELFVKPLPFSNNKVTRQNSAKLNETANVLSNDTLAELTLDGEFYSSKRRKKSKTDRSSIIAKSTDQKDFVLPDTSVIKSQDFIFEDTAFSTPKKQQENISYAYEEADSLGVLSYDQLNTDFGLSMLKKSQSKSMHDLTLTEVDNVHTRKRKKSFDFPFKGLQGRPNFDKSVMPPPLSEGTFAIIEERVNKSNFKLNLRKAHHFDDDESKRDSLEFDESLGILTPNQIMDDFSPTSVPEGSPVLPNPTEFAETPKETKRNSSGGLSPILPCPDFNLGKLVVQEATFEVPDDKNLASEIPSPILQCPDFDLSKMVAQEVPEYKNLASEIPSPILPCPDFSLGKATTFTTKVADYNAELPSPNTEFSLGIMDERLLSTFTATTINMELPLDVNRIDTIRLEQTPSPEELPLDPTPLLTTTIEIKNVEVPCKSNAKTSNSFITSVTSITSIDTGYQGDGEMSRPASRGPDNSPLTRRPLARPVLRRPDPMTDSDFYTESDADGHEDNPLRGDRKAQVIDGTLYGVDPQAAADIYVNNRENMDSSGIFTDIESNTRNDDLVVVPNDVSPSESTKTISENSQNISQNVEKPKETPKPKDNQSKKRIASSPPNCNSPRLRNTENLPSNTNKKYKSQKRDSPISKITKTQPKDLVPPPPVSSARKTFDKQPSRWDAVMSKISKGEPKTNLKDIKSKVNSINNVPKSVEKEISANNKSGLGSRPSSGQKPQSGKPRRVRSRLIENGPTASKLQNSKNPDSSLQSSLSDLSGVTSPAKKSLNATKKRDVQVTQVLTASKLAKNLKNSPQEIKRTPFAQIGVNETKNNNVKKNLFSPKDKKQTINNKEKETINRSTTAKPNNRNSLQQIKNTPPSGLVQKQNPRAAEALAVLVHHLVYNVEAYRVPVLKRQAQKYRLEAEEIKLSCQHLEEALLEEKKNHQLVIEEERIKYRNEISSLIEKHRNHIAQLNNQHADVEQRLLHETETTKQQILQTSGDRLGTLKSEVERLQQTHRESLDILREENESIREEIDSKNDQINELKYESLKLKEDYETKEIKYQQQIVSLSRETEKYKIENEKLKNELLKKEAEALRVEEDNKRLLGYGNCSSISVQEVESLRVVLEMKQTEMAELRKALAEATQRADFLENVEEKASLLQARCEDLQLQLQRKTDYELMLLSENKKLEESFREETHQKRRLSQHNEELQWRLKHNKEVIKKVLEQSDDVFNISFNDRHASATAQQIKQDLERTLSFRERSYSGTSTNSLEGSTKKPKNVKDFDLDDSPPSSPKVKGVVEKSDSVSWVLEINESPEVMAERLVRRSFRNTPTKQTPGKSPATKRPRMKNSPLALSASASAIMNHSKPEYNRSKSTNDYDKYAADNDIMYVTSYENFRIPENLESSRDDALVDFDDDLDIKLPALPNELKGTAPSLPTPKHLAGEAMISESNSEDESSSSGQL